jgi:hypothetical protein
VPGLLPHVRLGLRHPHRGGLAAALDECDAAVGLKAVGSLHLNDSQTPLGPTATVTPTSARASSAAADARSSSQSRASTTCPACSRRRGPTGTVRPGSRSR